MCVCTNTQPAKTTPAKGGTNLEKEGKDAGIAEEDMHVSVVVL